MQKGILFAQWVRHYKGHLCHKTTTNKRPFQYYNMSLKLWKIHKMTTVASIFLSDNYMSKWQIFIG